MGSTFVYGSLMAPEVLRILISRVPQHQPARLRGYARHGIQGYSFPAIAAARSDEVEGLVLSGLTDEELYVFDEFEDEGYECVQVQPVLEDGTTVLTRAYVWSEAQRHMLKEGWEYGAWREAFLREYEAMCTEWRAQLPPYSPS